MLRGRPGIVHSITRGKCRYIYHEGIIDRSFSESVKRINPLICFFDIDNISVKILKNKSARIWRFIPMADESVDAVCSRDLDSLLFPREEVAVHDWLKLGKIVHEMRDSIYHTSLVMAGLW